MKPASGPWRLLVALDLPSEAGHDRLAAELVATAVRDLDLPPDRLACLQTAVAEAALNAIEHGHRFHSAVPVHIAVRVSPAALSVTVADHGRGPGATAPEPDLNAKLAGEQSPRGWGLFLIRHMVDEVSVTVDEDHHQVELIMLRPRAESPLLETASVAGSTVGP